jgi:hypothetical protein
MNWRNWCNLVASVGFLTLASFGIWGIYNMLGLFVQVMDYPAAFNYLLSGQVLVLAFAFAICFGLATGGVAWFLPWSEEFYNRWKDEILREMREKKGTS